MIGVGKRMKQPSLYKLRGAVRIKVTGGDIETLINMITEQRLSVWDLRAQDGRQAEMSILLPHFSDCVLLGQAAE